jgi:hypothetical protein
MGKSSVENKRVCNFYRNRCHCCEQGFESKLSVLHGDGSRFELDLSFTFYSRQFFRLKSQNRAELPPSLPLLSLTLSPAINHAISTKSINMEDRHSISEPRPVRNSTCVEWEIDILRDETVIVDTFVLNNDVLPPRTNKKGKVLWKLPDTLDKIVSESYHVHSLFVYETKHIIGLQNMLTT